MTGEEKSREELEEEREFLLRSLDDLDSELVAGNIDPDSYRKLHDDYTARASAIIRSLDDGVDRPAPREPNLPPRDEDHHRGRHLDLLRADRAAHHEVVGGAQAGPDRDRQQPSHRELPSTRTAMTG